MQRFDGQPIAPGIAIGRIFIYRDIVEDSKKSTYTVDVEHEYKRIEDAISIVACDLQEAATRIKKELGEDASEIFRTQAAILNDESLKERLKAAMEDSLGNANQVVRQVFGSLQAEFQELDSDVLTQRSDDFADISRRLLHVLTGVHAHSLESLPPGSMLFAARLLPSDTVFLTRKSAAGICAEFGGRVSHAAILARELGIPSVSCVEAITKRVEPGQTAIVDGNRGTVIIDPDERTLRRYRKEQEHLAELREHAIRFCQEPAVTQEGLHIKILANVADNGEILNAVENGADGIGLFRTENFFFKSESPPSVNEIVEYFSEALQPARHLPITIRLLDAGGDKPIRYIRTRHEDNPVLGVRGIRLLLERNELLVSQFKAFVELAQSFRLSILVPMVTTVEDVRRTRAMLDLVCNEMSHSPPPLGAMIETPAAAIVTPELTVHSDFFSIGTNDLTQYTMAAGRDNTYVGQYFQDDHPAVLHLLTHAVNGAGNLPMSLCGELASQLDRMPELIRIGIRNFSVPPIMIPQVKEYVRGLDGCTLAAE